MKDKTILLVDDEVNILELLRYNLEKEQYQVITAETGERAIQLLNHKDIDLAVLDLMLPGIDGLEILKFIRNDERLKEIPVIMLTAKSSEFDTVIGLELGADDYLSKPFRIHELVARLKALFRRINRGSEDKEDHKGKVELDGLVIDQNTYNVSKNGVLIDVAPKEFSLLYLMAQHVERVFTRDELLMKVWGQDFLGESRTVDVHIKNLRKKIEDNPEEPQYIKTVRGVGYKMVRK